MLSPAFDLVLIFSLSMSLSFLLMMTPILVSVISVPIGDFSVMVIVVVVVAVVVLEVVVVVFVEVIDVVLEVVDVVVVASVVSVVIVVVVVVAAAVVVVFVVVVVGDKGSHLAFFKLSSSQDSSLHLIL